MRQIALTRGDALLVVDIQNDFLPGGSVAVPEGDHVIAPADQLIRLYHEHGFPLFFTRCWHPPGHCSFQERGGPWAPHCIAHTHGAAFPDALQVPEDAAIISKATGRDEDAYSGFRGTALAEQLRAHGVQRLAVLGLATDFCVLNTVSDALATGFRVMVVQDAVRAVDANPGDGERALALMAERGALLVHSRPASLLNEAALVDPAGVESQDKLLDPPE
ncbi:isochorismatase family protein [Massilia horti]|uniref:nicotinamidase n=1 Tax=Massilia horti TaxID=2562153 RepID=A0A4Y9T0D5_9BURK|nr:isochorismatase family protein [Massilia horti]TFW31301.1 isochorismatase family protein [Massilia horti]